jgi:hypothetical protein
MDSYDTLRNGGVGLHQLSLKVEALVDFLRVSRDENRLTK